MQNVFTRILCIVTATLFVFAQATPVAIGAPRAARDVASSDDTVEGETVSESVRTMSLLRFGAMVSAEPDSTRADSTDAKFKFPDEKKKHLTRDITVFVIVSAFVAAFVINVFLRGNTDIPTDHSPPGKTVP